MSDFEKKSSEMARAAWLYYAEELTQSQIAEKLNVSRSTVIRMIQRARELGLVSISIGVPSDTFELERDLENRFGLQRVRLVPEAVEAQMQRRWLGQAAAEMLVDIARDHTTIALSWGSTMQAMADSLQGSSQRSGMMTVALNGGLHNASRGTNPHEVAELVGQYFGAISHSLYAPVYVRNEATAAGLYRDPGVQEALNLARNAALVVFSFGGIQESATMLKLGYVTPEERDFLLRNGAVGEIAGRWIDRDGETVRTPSTIHPIGITVEELKRIPERMAVAGGPEKLNAIHAGLKGGLVTHFISDEHTAKDLLSR
jgi:DNA-binding transcriptional regulator LsrR (DeoR family)